VRFGIGARGLDVGIDREEYLLGDTVEATMTVKEAAVADGRAARLELLYARTYSAGTNIQNVGDVDVTTSARNTVETVVVKEYVADSVVAGSYSARLQIPPAGPPSSHTEVKWSVRAVLVDSDGKTVKESTKLRVLAPRSAFAAHAELPVWRDPRCPMTIEVADRNVLVGDDIPGTLVITPAEDVEAKQIRLTFQVCRMSAEVLLSGKPVGVYVWRKAKLAADTHLQAGGRYEFPFQIEGLQLSQPSFEGPDFQAIWYLEAMVKQAWNTEYRARLPLNVYNAS
jgi:hypothetical protein